MFEANLLGRMDGAAAAMAAASADLLAAVAAFDDQRLWLRDGATSMTSWLAARYNLTRATAVEWVRVAHALRSLPGIAHAYAFGRLSWDQLRPLTKFARTETDEQWAKEAPFRSSSWLWLEARRQERVRTEDVEEVNRLRYLEMGWNEERTVLYLQGRIGAEQGAAFERSVLRHAEHVVVADDPLDPTEARQVDALVELVTGLRAEDPSTATLVVHAAAEVLTGDEDDDPLLAETESGERLSSEAVRRLACDARIEWVLESNGRPVGIGRRGRGVPGALGRVLRHRERECRFPGCGRTRWLKAHHLIHWARGGGTDLENLILLCHAHHRLIHEGGWTTSGNPAKNLRFHDPTRRPLRTAAERLGEPSAPAVLTRTA